jgi:hypothetical protein
VIIDFHTHILPDEFRTGRARFADQDRTFGALFADPAARTASAEDLDAEMECSGVDVSVALGYGWTDPAAASLSNDYLLDAARRFPGRIVPFCSVNPAWGADGVREAERCAAAGARGIGELHADTQGFDLTDPDSLAPLMGLAREAGLTVVVHGSEPVGHTYPGKGTTTPDRLAALAAAFPGVRFVFAHWGGGLPFYALMPEIAGTLQNAYFDSAATSLLYRPEVFAVACGAVGPGQLLFGSDYPLLRQGRVLREARGAGLSDGELAALLGGNAARLLSLEM